jgi:hypothetical protein
VGAQGSGDEVSADYLDIFLVTIASEPVDYRIKTVAIVADRPLRAQPMREPSALSTARR